MHSMEGGTCQGITCGTGGNSPYTNVFPVNGISPSGKCNKDGIRFVPGSFKGGECDGGDLVFRADLTPPQLVARKNGKECSGSALKGTQFTVRATRSVNLKISDVVPFKERSRDFVGYRITFDHDDDEVSVCDFDEAVVMMKLLGLKVGKPGKPLPEPDGAKQSPYAKLLIPMAGAIYDVNDATDLKLEGDFFNLACGGDALAKTALDQLDSYGQSALKMITAKYKGSQSYTVRSVEIGWATPDDDKARVPEAYWDNSGNALCLDTPRLVNVKSEHVPIVKRLPAKMQPTGCESGNCEPDIWETNLKSDLKLGGCPQGAAGPAGAVLRSYWSNGKVILMKVTPNSPIPTAPTNPGPDPAN